MRSSVSENLETPRKLTSIHKVAISKILVDHKYHLIQKKVMLIKSETNKPSNLDPFSVHAPAVHRQSHRRSDNLVRAPERER